MEVGHAPAYPEVADERIRFPADQAWRTTLKSAQAGSGILDDRRLIGQIIRDDTLSDASSKLLIGHRYRFAAVSSKAMMIASMFRSSRIALSLNLSASSRRSSSVSTSHT